MQNRWIVPNTLAIALLALWNLTSRAGDGFVGNTIQTFSAQVDSPLRLPTAVAVATNGTVYVADGVNDRVLVFDASGAEIGTIQEAGGVALQRPISVKIDATGRVWITDTGNHRLVVFSGDRVFQQQIEPPRGDAAREVDLTDIAFSTDGALLWAIDNDNHRILRWDFAAQKWTSSGQRGEALGQFQFPFMACAAATGDLVVTDVINARLQLLNAAGQTVAGIGAYGVEPGELYRPTGVALDQSGNVWVADSVTGVVQVFRQNGEFVAVLNDPDDKPLRFGSPMGLAIDGQGYLYVTELQLNQVRKIAIARAAPSPLPSSRKLKAENAQHARGCTICHFDWMPAFADGRDSALALNPGATKENPVVSRSETCLSCHNGSVADSRRRVWQEHGHRTGTAPPATMRVPPNLPLIDGNVACRTCHSAHRAGNVDTDLGKAVFLRVENSASELCKSCHVDKTRGEQFGTHPTGGMPWPVPQALIDAGAHPGPNPRELTCQVCHTPHGAKYDHLLVIGANTNQLCLTCHDQLRPGMFRLGGPTEHPLAAHVNAEQTAAVADMDTRLGPDGQLICLTCHKLHHGHGKRFMLADELADGQMCLRCHSQRKILVGTSHDLRVNHPAERNRLGMTPTEGGPCSACHLFHRFARQVTPNDVDPTGQCTSCHQTGQCAEAKLPGTVNHPLLRCTECHNPHEPRFGKFLRGKPEDVCSMCHAEKAKLTGGPHDARSNEDDWCKQDLQASDRCLACHRPHGNEQTGLFRIAPSAAGGGPDAACVACHPGAAWGSESPITAAHPQTGTLLKNVKLPLVAASAGADARIGCQTCHNPHNSPEAEYLLRSGGTPEALCTTCHTDMRQFARTNHSAPFLDAKGFTAGACRPCHLVHADPKSIEPKLMWSASLNGVTSGVAGVADDRYCIGCHRDGGEGPVPAIYTHPVVPMNEPLAADGQSTLRLFDADGSHDQQGYIACRTCHTPHGRMADVAALASNDATHQEAGALNRGLRLQVRSFEPPNLCTTCHGPDALRRFLYFHDPQRRAGPLISAR